jgi:glycosyltransferase involved in cell wall biosynthesis
LIVSARPALSIVVPARNEGHRLEATARSLVSLQTELGPKEVLFVVDSTSEDDTVEVAERIARGYSEIRIESVDSKGKGFAVSIGVREAIGEIVVLADADLSVQTDQFASLIAPARAGALAIASRSVPGAHREGEPVTRYVFGRLFNLAVRSVMLPGVRDTQCGFKAFRRELLARAFETLESPGWCFDVELIATATRAGMPVVEVPVRWRYGHGSKMKLTKDAPEILRELYRLRRRFGRLERPGGEFRDGVTEPS